MEFENRTKKNFFSPNELFDIDVICKFKFQFVAIIFTKLPFDFSF